MTAVDSPIVSSESAVVKMEDRKRPAAENNESAPPSKKQATTVNGGSKPHPDADMPWRDDLERFQKDAILRQMQEYKREKASLESQLNRMTKAAAYHDDHLRAIDAWFHQLVDEVKMLLGPSHEQSRQSTFKSSLQFEDVDEFEAHLKTRSGEIREIITYFQSSVDRLSPDVTSLQEELTKKLAEEKVTIAKLEQTIAEKQQLEESLEAASLRYMVAEKKLDRARSLTVAKLEKQYLLGGQRSGSENVGTKRDESSPANGGASSAERNTELEESYNKLNVVSEKQKEQLSKLEAENATLLAQITDVQVKVSKLTDDDYAHTDLFKQLRSQHDDVVKRLNHLEATNAQLRVEVEKYSSERNAYKLQLEEESNAAIAEKEAALMRAESDLARIRNTRDELFADQQIRKTSQDQEKLTGAKLQELADAREARIAALESEVERLRVQEVGSTTTEEIDKLSTEELRAKYASLDRQYSMLNTELTSMQTAYKKFSTLASQKVTDFKAWEDKVARLTAEKSKADQKYFAAMKSKEARDAEVRILRMQNSKTSDIVSQLKESEAATRSLLLNMDKQVNEMKEALKSASDKQRNSQQQLTESNIAVEGLKKQVAELKSLSTSKDATLSSTSAALRQAETELVGLKQTLTDTKKSLDNWKNKSLGNNSSEYEMLRTLALCTVCRRNFKNTVIKTCGHVFCKDCVEERLTSRSRKCPNCNRSFGSNDHMHITL
ncbi:E3 ubiquitin ligase [Penicillium ucsense]|uniref:E3 ubiquitin protein ligase n=1 Tax=Penicillium ucsense TaxID=2839758 RepID=A0A8J8W954_9EURO|nr:E3 ubiquitin ligase [Penicillium ucsense]KAF7737800.1 E3 ubiquitin ligase [Penicillium ucsense]